MLKSIKLNPLVISLLSIFIGGVAYFIGFSFIDRMELNTIDLRFQTEALEVIEHQNLTEILAKMESSKPRLKYWAEMYWLAEPPHQDS